MPLALLLYFNSGDRREGGERRENGMAVGAKKSD
jgi:hypothetical protein